MSTDAVVRRLIADAVGQDESVVAALPGDTRLFGPEVGLSSLAGARLLDSVRERFGVDVAAEDLNLDALESIASLSGFVERRA
ncbi:acyl carrier protein [Allokutzneria sp. A3M-2-11 16]|uniref:acyl carrier protein n=1 Tax=Allokutzneria sp. A3M-2-11 16 TaxID=2962043 RepID=UPI0020B77113|nr:acyl carrier protein [Allokutzneria sp. A3M-2-11 16]MCP3800781.1 acyl carrier protein [Allokutzneria sp. A3M-2-11 16]